MPDPVDMSFNEIIRNKKKSMRTRRGKGSGGGPGPACRFGNLELLRTTPYSVAPALQWKQEMFTDGASSMETGTKLYISNLEYCVSNDDIKGTGRDGTAEVVFLHQTDALAAIRRYNNVKLDGKPLKIDLIGANISTLAVVQQPTTKSMMGKPKGFFRRIGDMGAAKRRFALETVN